MAELISLLGANYTVWERWGGFILLASGLVASGAALAIIRAVRLTARVAFGVVCAVALSAFGLSGFVMRYIEALAVPPGYRRADVAFAGPSGRLGGELLLPGTPGRHPAVVLVTGSDISSYRTNYAPLANELITPTAARHGFAILYVDRRGVGRSAGDWTDAGIRDRANDLLAALQFLRAHPSLDPARLMVIGHSQGGWVAQLLAGAQTPAAMVLSLAGPAVGVEEQIIDDEAGALACAGRSDIEAAAEARALVDDLRQQSRGATGGRLHQLARIIDYRPDDALRAIAVPTVLVFGAHDRLVPADSNQRRLDQIWGGTPPPHVAVHTVPGAGHSLRLVERCQRRGMADAPFAPDVLDIMDRAFAAVAALGAPRPAPPARP